MWVCRGPEKLTLGHGVGCGAASPPPPPHHELRIALELLRITVPGINRCPKSTRFLKHQPWKLIHTLVLPGEQHNKAEHKCRSEAKKWPWRRIKTPKDLQSLWPISRKSSKNRLCVTTYLHSKWKTCPQICAKPGQCPKIHPGHLSQTSTAGLMLKPGLTSLQLDWLWNQHWWFLFLSLFFFFSLFSFFSLYFPLSFLPSLSLLLSPPL